MAVLRKPGAIVEEVLPSDENLPAEKQTKLLIKIPSEGGYRTMLKMDMLSRTGMLDGLEYIRTRFGTMIERIDNLTFEDGEVYSIEKDKDGRLTPRNAAMIMPLSDEISGVLDRCCRVSEEDRKNS